MERGRIQTVSGPINPEQLGKVTMHEHIFIDFKKFHKKPENPEEETLSEARIGLNNLYWVQYHVLKNKDNLTINEIEIACHEVALFKAAGGGTIVEATTHGIGRDAEKMCVVAQRTAVNIVMGAGHYVGAVHPPSIADESVEAIERRLCAEITDGLDGTNIKAGIVGEIGTSWPISDTERKVLIAAARAAKKTGAMLNIHPGRHADAPLACLQIVKEAAGQEQLSRTVMSHIDRTVFDPKAQEAIAATGAVLEFDMPSDEQRIRWIQSLIQAGYKDQIVIAHDIYTKHRLQTYGGHGYYHILEKIVPRMRRVGIPEDCIDRILVHTPRRLLTLL